jgi:hypothetical protein
MCWSADGRRLYVLADGRVHVMDAATGAVAKLSDTSYRAVIVGHPERHDFVGRRDRVKRMPYQAKPDRPCRGPVVATAAYGGRR